MLSGDIAQMHASHAVSPICYRCARSSFDGLLATPPTGAHRPQSVTAKRCDPYGAMGMTVERLFDPRTCSCLCSLLQFLHVDAACLFEIIDDSGTVEAVMSVMLARKWSSECREVALG
jgi:hypothetical protein